MNIENILKRTNEIIKKYEELNQINDFKSRYVLIDKNDDKNPIIVAYGYDEMYKLDITNDTFIPIADWDYDFDNDIFGELEDGKEIGYMDFETHYNIWCSIDDIYDDIEHIDGMNKYLEYCLKNNITKETIDEKIKLDVPDVMKYFNKNDELER